MSLLFTTGGAMVNALAFSSTNFDFSIHRSLWRRKQKTWLSTWKASKGKRWMEERSNEASWFYEQKTAWKKWRESIHRQRWWSNARVLWRLCETNKALTTWAWFIRFVSSFGGSKKWWTIICCSGYRHCNICPIQVP